MSTHTDYMVGLAGAFSVRVIANGHDNAIAVARSLSWLREPQRTWVQRHDVTATAVPPLPDTRPSLPHPREVMAYDDNPYGSDRPIECDECGVHLTEREYLPFIDCDCDQDGFFQTNDDLCAECRLAKDGDE